MLTDFDLGLLGGEQVAVVEVGVVQAAVIRVVV